MSAAIEINQGPSIVLGEPAHVYHQRRLGEASKSALDLVARSPAHYRAWVDGYDPEPTDAMRFGNAAHVAILEPDRFARAYRVAPDFGDMRSSKNREKRDAWLAENPGVTMLTTDEWNTLFGMAASIAAHPAAARLFMDGQPEVSLRWTDENTGLRCRARADYWVKSKRLVVDLKTTVDASPKEFARSVAKFRYHVQDASYRAGFLACGEPIDHFAIVAVEKVPPYACAVYTLDHDAVERGFYAHRSAIELLADCVRRDEWPAYSDGIEELSLPPWA